MALGAAGSSYYCSKDNCYYVVDKPDGKGGYVVHKSATKTSDYTEDNTEWNTRKYHEGDITDAPAGAPVGYGSMKFASFASNGVGGGAPAGGAGGASDDADVNQIAAEAGIPAGLLYAQMMRESVGNQGLVGDAGASFGCMQIQKGTWDDFRDSHKGELPDDLKNASIDDLKKSKRLNLEAGAFMMKAYHDEWKGKGYGDDQSWQLALRQYNSGSVPNPSDPNQRPVGDQAGNPGGYIGDANYVKDIWGNYVGGGHA